MNTLDLQAAAAFLHTHPVTLQQKARAGKIPGAKIGRCWVFVDVDLVEHIRSQYPRRVLQSERKEFASCHSTNAPIHRVGGSRSATAEEQYSAALGLKDMAQAQEYHDKLKVSLWEQQRLGVKPHRAWKEAVVRWLAETSEKVTHPEDMRKLRWLDPFLGSLMLDEVTLDVIDAIKAAKLKAACKPTVIDHKRLQASAGALSQDAREGQADGEVDPEGLPAREQFILALACPVADDDIDVSRLSSRALSLYRRWVQNGPTCCR